MKCSICGCKNEYYAKGFCGPHYRREWKRSLRKHSLSKKIKKYKNDQEAKEELLRLKDKFDGRFSSNDILVVDRGLFEYCRHHGGQEFWLKKIDVKPKLRAKYKSDNQVLKALLLIKSNSSFLTSRKLIKIDNALYHYCLRNGGFDFWFKKVGFKKETHKKYRNSNQVTSAFTELKEKKNWEKVLVKTKMLKKEDYALYEYCRKHGGFKFWCEKVGIQVVERTALYKNDKDATLALSVFKKKFDVKVKINSAKLQRQDAALYKYCKEHHGWKWWCKKLRLHYQERKVIGCKILGCPREHNSWGFCSTHVSQVVLGIIDLDGNKLRELKVKPIEDKEHCIFQGCPIRPNEGYRMCDKHRSQITNGIIDKNGNKIREPYQSILESPIVWEKAKHTCKGVRESRTI